MAKLVIKDSLPDLNGEYELDLAGGFTKSEYFLIKKNVGVVVGDFAPGAPLDANVMTAWGLVVLRRAGKEHLIPAYMETTDAQTEWDFSDEEVADESIPPTNSPDGNSEPNDKNDSSGADTANGSGDFLATTQPHIGSQG